MRLILRHVGHFVNVYPAGMVCRYCRTALALSAGHVLCVVCGAPLSVAVPMPTRTNTTLDVKIDNQGITYGAKSTFGGVTMADAAAAMQAVCQSWGVSLRD